MEKSKYVAPELLRQLEGLAEGGATSAVFTLRRVPEKPLLPEETVRRAGVLIDRVSKIVGDAPLQCNVFKNMGSFVVLASRAFLERLLQEEEIASATANVQSQDLLIRPVKSKRIPPK